MGKKHKKHKSEKHTYDEYGERPLKLVLKVAGNEVTTGGGSVENVLEESVDYNTPHKDKKKKKKKKEDRDRSNPGSPIDKRKMTKKRKGQDPVGADWEDSRASMRSDMSQDKPISSLAKMAEKPQTPLQEALSQLIRQLQRKDPSAFFCFPVTDLIAPGYSMVIRRPMDFSTMKEKVKREYYQSLLELKADFKLMCENAMNYNKPDTIFYRAAKKLLHSGLKILSPERLDSLKQSIEFMADLETNGGREAGEGGSSQDQSRDGSTPMDTGDSTQSSGGLNKAAARHDKDSKDEVQKAVSQAEKDLQEIRKIIEESGHKLSNRELQVELEFERRKQDGSTSLAILNPVDLSAGDPGYCPVKLGMMSGRLQSGVNTLQGFKEDKRNRISPVAYLNYGPFTSYGPAYDSTFSSVSKEDSDLLYSFYGEESSSQGSDSMADFLSRSDEHMSRLGDRMLDALTNGQHSKTLKEAEANNPSRDSPSNGSSSAATTTDDEVVESAPRPASSQDSVDTLKALGLDFLIPKLDSKEAREFQEKLDETTQLLSDLQEAQKERLSTPQPPNIICLLAPTTKEVQLAEKVTGNLALLTSRVAPGDVSSVYGIRKAMGISLPCDLDEPLIDLTTVGEVSEPMEILPARQDDVPVITV